MPRIKQLREFQELECSVLLGFAILCPANLVRHIHVRHFQSTRLSHTRLVYGSALLLFLMLPANLLYSC